MQSLELQKLVLDALEDSKALNIVDLDIRSLTSIADRMIICTGTSRRHTQSIADNIVVKIKAENGTVLGVQGDQEGEWILIDLGDIIVHVMLAETRQFYSLEKLWTTAKAIRNAKQK